MGKRPSPRNRLNDLSNSEWLRRTKSFWISEARPAKRSPSASRSRDGDGRPEWMDDFAQWLRAEKGEEAADQVLGQVYDSFVYSQPPARDPLKSQHPATFAEADVQKLIEFFTRRRQSVLDPFLGSGSTLIACHRCGRKGLGIELSPRWAQVARRRLKDAGASVSEFDGKLSAPGQKVVCGDARAEMARLRTGSVHFIVTSPPYWRILRKNGMKVAAERTGKGLPTHYSEADADLGNIADYQGFLAELDVVWRECARTMRKGRYMCVIVCDFRHGPDFYLYHADIARHVEDSGLKLQGVTILAQDNKTLYPYGVPNAFVSNIHHQYILIFRKPL
ncbi:MAG: DNA methyltransferase [Armatimonadota bacterium]